MLHVPLDLHWNQRTTLQRNQKREKGNKHNNKERQLKWLLWYQNAPQSLSWLAKRLTPISFKKKTPTPLSQSKLKKNLAQARFPAFQLHRVDGVFLSLLIWFKWFSTRGILHKQRKLTSSFLLFLPPRGVYSLSPWYKLVRYIMISFLSGWSTSISCFKRKLPYQFKKNGIIELTLWSFLRASLANSYKTVALCILRVISWIILEIQFFLLQCSYSPLQKL